MPQGITSAQLNLSYCIASLLLDGEVFVDQFTEDKLVEPRRLALAERIRMEHDPEITAKGPRFRHLVRVQVFLKDGSKRERTVEISRHKANFMPDADVVQKFEKLAAHVLPRPQVERLRDAVLSLDTLKDASELARLLAKP